MDHYSKGLLPLLESTGKDIIHGGKNREKSGWCGRDRCESFCWQRRPGYGREEAGGGAARRWISPSSRVLPRHVGRGPGQQHEVFAHGYKQIAGDGQSGAPKIDHVPRGSEPGPGVWGRRVSSLKEIKSNVSEEKLLTRHPLMVIINSDWF